MCLLKTGKEFEAAQDDIVKYAKEAIKHLTESYPKEMEGRDGGHLIIWQVGDIYPTITAQVLMGIYPTTEEKLLSWKTNAKEKAERLSEMTPKEYHYSSWQSRDFENKKYGGAVRAGEWIFSFSGLIEHLDELFMIELAIRFAKMHPRIVGDILKFSENPFEV